MLESTRRTLTNGSSGGLRWTLCNVFMVEVRRFTATCPAQCKVEERSLRLSYAAGARAHCAYRAGASKGRLL